MRNRREGLGRQENQVCITKGSAAVIRRFLGIKPRIFSWTRPLHRLHEFLLT